MDRSGALQTSRPVGLRMIARSSRTWFLSVRGAGWECSASEPNMPGVGLGLAMGKSGYGSRLGMCSRVVGSRVFGYITGRYPLETCPARASWRWTFFNAPVRCGVGLPSGCIGWSLLFAASRSTGVPVPIRLRRIGTCGVSLGTVLRVTMSSGGIAALLQNPCPRLSMVRLRVQRCGCPDVSGHPVLVRPREWDRSSGRS